MKLFICYAHVDRFQVNEIVEILREAGHDAWFDYRLLPGQDWQAMIGQAVADCEVFAYTLSPESLASEWCQWEFAEAVRLGKPILPIRLQTNVKLPDAISRYQYADFSEGPTRSALARLFGGLHQAAVIPLNALPPAPVAPEGIPAQAVEATEDTLPDQPPLDLSPYVERGNAKFEDKDYLGAIADFMEAILVNPEDWQAYFGRGKARFLLNDREGALVDFNTFLDANPDFIEAYLWRAKARFHTNDRVGAVKDFTIHLEAYPQSFDTLFERGRAYQILGQHDNAIADFTTAIPLCKDTQAIAQVYTLRADTRKAAGDGLGAINDYEEAMRVDPTYWRAYDQLATQYKAMRNTVMYDAIKRMKKERGGPA